MTNSAIQVTEELARLQPAPPALSTRMLLRHALLLAGLFLLLSILYWVAVYAVAGRPGFPLDDCYISLQYARSLWEGHPFEYNFETVPGLRSGGSSTPLWIYLLAGTYALVRDWVIALYVLGTAWTLIGVALAYWLMLRWTGKPAWALTGAALLVLTYPTTISAFGGMEVPGYVGMFILGLLLYDFSRTASPGRQIPWRLAASLAFAVGVWLRPEFLLLPLLIAAERFLSLRRQGPNWFAPWLGEMSLHAIAWLLCIVPYLAFNWWVAGTLLPNTYTIKSVARNATFDGTLLPSLPSAWQRKDWLAAVRCLTLGQALMAVSLVVGLFLNNLFLALKTPKALRDSWRGALGPAGVLAGLSLLAFPMIRALVDPSGLFIFQFQRYFGHITVLFIALTIAWLARCSAAPNRRLIIGLVLASLLGPAFFDFQAVKAIDNINDMHVYIGQWFAKNTPPDATIAANDIGAIAFYSHRRVIDTVGLTEPDLARHYLAGGNLEGYLRQVRPQYACLLPTWHAGIAERTDLFETMFRVRLGINIICGDRRMYVLRTCWNPDFGKGPIDPEARSQLTAPQAVKGK